MTRSEFRLAVEAEFGAAYGAVLLTDLTLAELGGLTAEQALIRGIPPREIWLALCAATDVAAERRHGVGRPERNGSV